MRYSAFIAAVWLTGCAQQSQYVGLEYLSHIRTRVVYTAAHPVSGELEIRNSGTRTVYFADPLFTFSAKGEPIRCSLSSSDWSGAMPQFEARLLRARALIRIPILPNASPAQHVGAYFLVNGTGYDAAVVWSENIQR
jgi:hypothetical protein